MAACCEHEEVFSCNGGGGKVVYNYNNYCCGCCGNGGEPGVPGSILDRLKELEEKMKELEEKVENCDCCDCGENPDDPRKPGPGIINVVREGRLIHSWPAGSDASVAIYSKDYAQAGDTIYIGEGTFECSTPLYTYSCGITTHLIPANVNVVGVPGKTVVVIPQDAIAPSQRDNAGVFNGVNEPGPSGITKNDNSTVRNIIYDYRMAPKEGVYANALFTHTKGLRLDHCVIKCAGSDNVALTYYNASPSELTLNHCTFISDMEPAGSYSGIGGSALNDCAYNKDIVTLASGATVTNSNSNLDIDTATYRIMTGGADDPGLNASCGVYSGPDAWPWP